VSFPAIGIGSGVLGFRSYWRPSPFPLPSRLVVFHSLRLPLDFNHVSSLRPTYRHPFGQPCTYSLLGEFPGLGLDLIADVVVPEADQLYTWSRKLDPNFCPGRGIPQAFASNARACKMLSTRAFEFSRLQCECLLNRSSRRLARTIDITHKVYLTPMVNIK